MPRAIDIATTQSFFRLLRLLILTIIVVLILSATSSGIAVLAVFLCAGIWGFLGYKLCQKIRIHFDRNKFEIEYESLNFKFKEGEDVSNIFGVFLFSIKENDGRDYYSVKIRTEKNYYLIRMASKGLTEIEAAWLAQEIQDWLYDR